MTRPIAISGPPNASRRTRGRTSRRAGTLLLAILLPCGARGGGGQEKAVFAQAERPIGPPLQRPGYLGVSLRDLDSAESTRLHLPNSGHAAMGAMIVTVDRDAPAWAAGLRPGDVVIELNAQPVADVEDLRRRLRECPAGETVTLRVRRRGGEKSFAVALGDQDLVAQNALNRHLRSAISDPVGGASLSAVPGSFGWAAASPAPAALPSRGMASTLFDALLPGSSYTGLEVDPLTPQLAAFFGVQTKSGLLVTSVAEASPAALAGLLAGDVIVRAAGKPVTTRGTLAHALHTGKGSPVPLAIVRDHREITVSLQPGRRKRS